MKYLRILFTLALFCGFANHAWADGVNFHMSVLDPVITAEDITDPNATLPVVFGACPAIITADGCWGGFNDTTTTFTSLVLSFDSIPGDTPTCDTDVAHSVFGSSSCGLVGDSYQLFFSGGTGIAEGVTFFITETGLPPGDFKGGSVTINPTPEPESLLLFSTGLSMAGLVLAKRKRMFASIKK
jgi:hypothetical protein